jgi:hypothetical protein
VEAAVGREEGTKLTADKLKAGTTRSFFFFLFFFFFFFLAAFCSSVVPASLETGSFCWVPSLTLPLTVVAAGSSFLVSVPIGLSCWS